MRKVGLALSSLMVIVSACDTRKTESTPKPVKASSLTRAVSQAELAAHSSAESCWVVIDGVVYDVTTFIAEHPGGRSPLLRYCGKDASAPFNNKPHSDRAKSIREGLRVGALESGSSPAPVAPTPPSLTEPSPSIPAPAVTAAPTPVATAVPPPVVPGTEATPVPSPAATVAPSETVFTREEVAKHNVRADCWIILDEGVYDITNFFDVHPGGEAPVPYCGKDASDFFNSFHSDYARRLRMNFRIGRVAR